MNRIRTYLFLMLSALSLQSLSQDHAALQKELEDLAKDQTGLNENVSISVSGVPIADFLSAIAVEHQLNVSVDPALEMNVVNNFSSAKVLDVFMFLVKNHDIQIQRIGTILHFKPKEAKPEPKPVYKPKLIDVQYKNQNDFLSVNLRQDSLWKVAQAITMQSGKNVGVAPDVRDQLVNAYFENRPFADVLEMLASSNNLVVTRKGENDYFLEAEPSDLASNAATPPSRGGNSRNNRNSSRYGNNAQSDEVSGLELLVDDKGFLNVKADNVPASEIIRKAAQDLNVHYFMYNVPDVSSNVKVQGATFDELLRHMLNGTEFTFKNQDGNYLIGERKLEGLRSTELIRLENRTVETVIDLIPANLKEGLEVHEFIDLNGLVVSGSAQGIAELKEFLQAIDLVVPNVHIEVMVFQYNEGHNIGNDIEMGIATESTQTTGRLFDGSGAGFELGTITINTLISSLEGLGGFINLGRVTDNFYAKLNTLESNEVIDIQSTPKLSALNGTESTISIGETGYYQVVQNNLVNNVGNQNLLQSTNWKETNANLTVSIKPIVSADEQVTLLISVQQDKFTGTGGTNGEPPGKTTQSFESTIRVKNGEMILMGGLEESENSTKSSNGLPLLSRVPIIKWFTSDVSKVDSSSKLHIFIKPTIVY